MQDFIIVNQLNSDPLNLGVQSWYEDRLVELQITNMDELHSIPISIGNLDRLEKLILENNSITSIPDTICKLNINFLDSGMFSINGNFLCLENVPSCILPSIDFEFQTCEWNLLDVGVLQDIINLNFLQISVTDLGNAQTWNGGRLVELEITNMDDLYTVPSSIGNLDRLEKLILENNRIVHVPYSICDLNLNFLDSSKFSISGNYLCPNDVPSCILQSINPVFQTCEWNSQDIGVLQDIIDLNNLSVTAAELGAVQFWNWGRLATLNIPATEGFGIISQLPESIYFLDSLQSIDLRQNHLQSLPENFGSLHMVEYLDLSSNQLQFLPENIGYMESLEYIDLTENNLSNLPGSMVMLSHCEMLDISFNNLEQFPEILTTLATLQELNLAFNFISEMPASISGLSGLDILDIYFNDIYNLPGTLTTLSGLEVFDAGMNLIENIPNNIGNMTGLDVLFLDGNQLTFLPESLCNLTLDFQDEWSFKIENNLLCIENVPECVQVENILGSQDCNDGS